jgi:hypothetical protein
MSNQLSHSIFPDYSKRDHEIVDYQFYELPEVPGVGFRGPPVDPEHLASGNYFTIIGAAQSLGVYVPEPYANLLSEAIGLPCLNLSIGGINPGYYAANAPLLERANHGRFVILQVLTARVEPNDRLEPIGIASVRDRTTGEVNIPEMMWDKLLREDRSNLPRYVEQSVASWTECYKQLIAELDVPVLLFYFSCKPADATTNFAAATLQEFLGPFPQFVSAKDVEQIAQTCQGYAECRSDRNAGHRLISRFTGAPVQIDMGNLHPDARGTTSDTHNTYYPSHEMHQDALAPLLIALKKMGLLV